MQDVIKIEIRKESRDHNGKEEVAVTVAIIHQPALAIFCSNVCVCMCVYYIYRKIFSWFVYCQVHWLQQISCMGWKQAHVKIISLQQTINVCCNLHKIHYVNYILHLLALVITGAVIPFEIVSHWQHFSVALSCIISMEH